MTNPDYKLQLHQNKIKRILFAALPIYILSEKWIKSVSNEAYLEAQRISTNLTQTARQLMLNAIYKNETNVIFSLKLNDEAAHGKFFDRKRTVRRSQSRRSFEHKLDSPILSSKLDRPLWSTWTVHF